MKDFLFSNVDNFRYERKFSIEGKSREEIETMLKFHPLIFREIYHKRYVNSIYFDTFNLQHYFDNVNGLDRRLKVRIRWYNDLFGHIKNPTLEIKIKHNQHIGKLLYPLKSFNLENNFSNTMIQSIFNESSLNESLRLYLKDLILSLLISYNRKYFMSSDGKYRITLDTEMTVFRLNPYQNIFLEKYVDNTNTILELKYDKPHDEFVEKITNYFSFRLSRSSKYISGLNRFCNIV